MLLLLGGLGVHRTHEDLVLSLLLQLLILHHRDRIFHVAVLVEGSDGVA